MNFWIHPPVWEYFLARCAERGESGSAVLRRLVSEFNQSTKPKPVVPPVAAPGPQWDGPGRVRHEEAP